MPYFVRIGVVGTNKSGVGSRGYQLFRRGIQVFARWGSIKVLPGRHFVWIYRQEKTYRFRSEPAAKAELQKMIEDRTKNYSKLPATARIR